MPRPSTPATPAPGQRPSRGDYRTNRTKMAYKMPSTTAKPRVTRTTGGMGVGASMRLLWSVKPGRVMSLVALLMLTSVGIVLAAAEVPTTVGEFGSFLKDVGFPVLVAWYVLWRIEPAIKELTTVVSKMSAVLEGGNGGSRRRGRRQA